MYVALLPRWVRELYCPTMSVEASSFVWLWLIISNYQPRCRLLHPTFSCLLRRVKCAVLFFLSSSLLSVAFCPSRAPFSALGRVCARQSEPQGTHSWPQLLMLFRLHYSELYCDWHLFLLRNILVGALLGEGGGVGDWCHRSRHQSRRAGKMNILCKQKVIFRSKNLRYWDKVKENSVSNCNVFEAHNFCDYSPRASKW